MLVVDARDCGRFLAFAGTAVFETDRDFMGTIALYDGTPSGAKVNILLGNTTTIFPQHIRV